MIHSDKEYPWGYCGLPLSPVYLRAIATAKTPIHHISVMDGGLPAAPGVIYRFKHDGS
jgi:hypothetical protein